MHPKYHPWILFYPSVCRLGDGYITHLSSVVYQSEVFSGEGVVAEELPGGSALKVGVAYALPVQLVQKCFVSGLARNTRESLRNVTIQV